MDSRPRGRPPGAGPPVRFLRFGSFTDGSWLVSEQDDPGEVAAAYAQQQLIVAIRKRLGRHLSAADVARALGQDPTNRTVADVWSGRRAISMRMWFAIVLAYDIDAFAYIDPADRTTLLPQAHRLWLGPWRPGDGLPRFRAPFGPASEPAWAIAARHMSAWLDREHDAGRLHLADSRVATHAAVGALAEAGLSVALVADPDPGSPSQLTYGTEPPIELAVHLLLDSASRATLLTVVENVHQIALTATGRSIAILLLTPRSIERLDALIPGCTQITRGNSVRIPSSLTHSMAETTLTTLVRDFATNGYLVAIYDLHKSGNQPSSH